MGFVDDDDDDDDEPLEAPRVGAVLAVPQVVR